MIGGRRGLQGRKPGDRRVRVERPHTTYFRYAGPGTLVAREAASAPTTATGRALARARAVLFGRPLSSEEESEERLSKKKALAIFSSDAISSSAYATEEILRVLVLGGAAALFLSLHIAIAISILLAVVSVSYRQIGHAYPDGGGAYAVARRNLNHLASLVAAAALLIDYVLTVAVSTSSAVEQMVSAVPALHGISVVLGVGAIALITLGNLRGLRESGNIFAVPTYLFIATALVMICFGIYDVVIMGHTGSPAAPLPGQPSVLEPITILLVLKAFAAGSVALTGTEAIANGVQAFKAPESRNAAQTLTAMAILLAVLFIGITFLSNALGVVAIDDPVTGRVSQTVVAQVAGRIFGYGSVGFYAFQTFTALILFLAANTSFNAFPRLAAILARDRYMPRQFSFKGDRLAFTMGIVLLGAAAAVLVVVFRGETSALIPLYSVGVFIAFTISQGGMVRHWLREQSAGWRRRLAINAVGTAMTGVVAAVVLFEKAPQSLLVAVLIPLLVGLMLFINRQYTAAERSLAVRPDLVLADLQREERVIIPVPGINRAVIHAVNVGRSIADDVRAVLVTEDENEARRVRELWERQVPQVPLVVVESPYRALTGPLLAYLHVLDLAWPEDRPQPVTFVVIPEYVARHWWERILYNQSSRRLRAVLLGRPRTVIVSVPYRREELDESFVPR